MDRTIHPDDHMLAGGEEAYFRTALTGLRAVLAGVYAVGSDPAEVQHVLDFGSGYGRVYRALAVGFPSAELTACDLMPSAARFCAETFGGRWVQSHEDLAQVRLPYRYDVIWVGSVFTHLPAPRWNLLLQFLAAASRENGVVVFSSHGRKAIEHYERWILKRNPHLIPPKAFTEMKTEHSRSGFAVTTPQLATLRSMKARGISVSEGEYGFSFASEAWIRSLIDASAEWRFVMLVEGGWGNNHDTVTIQRC